MQKAFKFRIYPNTEQKTMFAKTFGCSRFIWNKMLADRIKYYKETTKSLHNTPAQYKQEFLWLKEVDSLALANVQMHLDKAYKSFFDGLKKGKKVGFPKFKSKKNNRHSYATNNQKGSVRIENGRIKLPKIGFVKLRQHRKISESYTIKTVTISQTPTNKYFVSILIEYENQVLEIVPQSFVGLDFSMHDLFVTSDGDIANYDHYLRKAEKKLAILQRKRCRKIKGSANREKARLKEARLHEKIANQRNDFLNKKSRELTDKYDSIAIEGGLDIKGMAKRKKKHKFSFGKSVSDNGWAKFVSMLEYKLAWQGKRLIRIAKWYPSSQLCHNCGYKFEGTKDLSVREWTCPSCKTHHNRDINAAINIKEEGKRIALT